jgi:hypothetical protein
VVTCIVHHVKGHAEASSFRAPVDSGAKMNEMQRSASSLTYAKRYAFQNAFGILTGDQDDDGRGAGVGEVGLNRRVAPGGIREVAPRQASPSPAPPPEGKNLVRIKKADVAAFIPSDPDLKDMLAQMKECIDLAEIIEVRERVERGQDAPDDETLHAQAIERCNAWLSRKYDGRRLDGASRGELAALFAILNRKVLDQ